MWDEHSELIDMAFYCHLSHFFHIFFCCIKKGQFCEYYGYRSENFTITTTDGYILTIFRCYRMITQRQPVLLVHGLEDSSDTWVMNPSSKSLGKEKNDDEILAQSLENGD